MKTACAIAWFLYALGSFLLAVSVGTLMKDPAYAALVLSFASILASGLIALIGIVR